MHLKARHSLLSRCTESGIWQTRRKFRIHQALAAAVDSYARARLAGHAVVSLLVGKSMSGAFWRMVIRPIGY